MSKTPQTFVIPDKRSADPEPMPVAVMKQFRCRTITIFSRSEKRRAIICTGIDSQPPTAWVPGSASRPRNDENFGFLAIITTACGPEKS
jgi:hypothetical protein